MTAPRIEPRVVSDPAFYIKWILAIAFIVGGLYLLSPYYIPVPGTPNGALAATVQSKITLWVFAGLYSFCGVLLGAGLMLKKKALQRWGLYSITLMVLFTVILQIGSFGLRPITWLAPLALGKISAVLWLRERWLMRNG